MDISEYESVDIDTLQKSLQRKFKFLPPLSNDCCIYRIPPHLRRLNESLYTPRIVSIGPIHRGREELKAMEEHKTRYLQDFLQRTKVSMKEFLRLIKDREAMLRGRYAEILKIGSEDFVKMILVDAAFIIELFLKLAGMSDLLNFGADRISTNQWILNVIVIDLFKLENQIPLFILEDMFKLAKTDMQSNRYDDVSLIGLICKCLEPLIALFVSDKKLVEAHFSKAEHLVDLIRICLQPSEAKSAENQSLYVPSATELCQAGVKFQVGSSRNLFDISFKDGILVIPNLKIGDESEVLLRNLQVFETLHCNTNHITDYIAFINFLVHTPKDAELLIHKGIISNLLWDAEGVSTLFHNLVKEASAPSLNFYPGVVKDLQSYCAKPWHKWKANLKQNYFNTPWASISVIGAVILLVLTCIQAVCSILAL